MSTTVWLQELFGKRLKQLREKEGITQEQLAETLGLYDHQAIWRFETGKNAPKFETIEKLSEALHVSVKDLFDFEGLS